MLFKVEAGKDIFESNPELKAIPAFADCPSRELKYVFLVYDYKTPFRDLPIEKRHEPALLAAGYRREPDGSRLDKNARAVLSGNSQRIKEAIGVFKTMQYDDDRELLAEIDSHIGQVRKFIKTDKKNNATKIKAASDMQKSLPDLLKQRKAVAELLEVREEIPVEEEEEDVMQDTKKLSTLDRINQRD